MNIVEYFGLLHTLQFITKHFFNESFFTCHQDPLFVDFVTTKFLLQLSFFACLVNFVVAGFNDKVAFLVISTLKIGVWVLCDAGLKACNYGT